MYVNIYGPKLLSMKMGGFHKAEDYVRCVEKRKREVEKTILQEFKSRGIDDLYKLREDFMLELRDIFESYPVIFNLSTVYFLSKNWSI